MSDAIERIKARLVDPSEVARLFGLDTKGAKRERRGGRHALRIRCLWHADRNPSLSLTLPRGGTLRARCFACKTVKDVVALFAASRGIPEDLRGEAWRTRILEPLAGLAGVDLDREDSAPRAPVRRSADVLAAAARPPFAPEAPEPIGPGDRAFGALVAPLLTLGRLDGGPLVRDVECYLRDRGILDIARAEGWAALPPAGSPAASSWTRMLRHVARDLVRELAGDIGRTRALRVVAGALRVVLGRDYSTPGRRRPYAFRGPRHQLVIPYRSPEGVLYTWQRRRLDAGEPKYLFPAGRPARWPHGIERLAGAHPEAPLVFCEGAIDAATLRALDAAAGRSRVVLGVSGTGAWAKGYFATFARGRVAFVATDVDTPKPGQRPAGDVAAEQWGADLWRAGARDVQRIRPPAGTKDWTAALEAAREGSPT